MGGPIPFAKFFDNVLAVYDSPGHATRTRTKMRHVLGLVLGLGVETTADLTTELAARLARERAETVTANTVRGDLAYLSAACSYAWEEGWLDRCPRFRRVRPRPSRPRSPRCHAIQDIARVLELLASRSGTWSGARLHALAAVVAYTAIRRDEALYLRVEDLDLTAGLLRIVDRRRLKTAASAASVPIPPELAEILVGWIPKTGSPWLFPGVLARGSDLAGTPALLGNARRDPVGTLRARDRQDPRSRATGRHGALHSRGRSEPHRALGTD